MPDPVQQQQDHAANVALYSQMFAVAGAMVGVCLTVIGLLRLLVEVKGYRTVADDLVAFDGILFLLACLFSFFMLKSRDHARRHLFRILTDVAFLLAITLMMALCALITWAFARIHS